MGLNFPLETRDDYENYLKSVLREKKYANKKIITIIDDLDRLDSSKIVEALDALKVFMDLDKCIFIVPFDDAILKKALEEKRVSNLTSTESEIDSDLILDKLFQYKVYIPELVKINIKKYAVELFQENCQDFIMEYMNGNMEEACRIVQNIVIHKHVSTPRQVKKLINNFINNMIIACKREKKQTVQKGFATELDSIRMIAKISVLQADFNEFYDTLFLNMNAMEEIVEVYREENDSPSEEVGRFFENIDERYELKPKYQSLINYLIHTEKYNKVPSLASYIYMAQDKISALTGDKKQQEFMETMLSKNMQSAQKMLENTPVFAEKICQYLDLEDDADDVLTVCNMAINLIESINQKYCDEVIRAISRRIEGCAKTVEYTGIEWLNINQYYWVRNHAEDKSVFDVSMEQYLNKLEQEKDVERVIISMLKYKNDFSAGVKQSVKKVIEEYADDGAYGLMNLAVMGQDLSIEETLDYIPEKMFVHITNELVEDRAELLNFVEDNFKQLQDKKAAVKVLNRKYGTLGEPGLETISNQIMNVEDEITALSKDMAKFYNKLSITRFSKLILKLYINNTPENIRKLLFNTDTTRTIDEVLEAIGKDSDDYTTAQLEEALDMYEQYGLKNEKIWYAIAKGYLTDNQETEQNEKILNLLNEKLNEKKIEKGNAAKLLNMIYYNTSSDELQKQVVKVTVERKVVVQFKKLLSADEKIEYDRKRKSM